MAGGAKPIYESFRNGNDKLPKFIQSQRFYHPRKHPKFFYGKKVRGEHQNTIIVIEGCVFFPGPANQVIQIKP